MHPGLFIGAGPPALLSTNSHAPSSSLRHTLQKKWAKHLANDLYVVGLCDVMGCWLVSVQRLVGEGVGCDGWVIDGWVA